MEAIRGEVARALEAARTRHFALGPVLVALRLLEESGRAREGRALAERCAAGFGHGPQAAEALVALARRARPAHFVDGGVVVAEGERADAVRVVVDGRVDAVRAGAGRVATYGAGDCFGEVEVVRGERWGATAVADGGASVLRLDAGLLGTVGAAKRGVCGLLDVLYRERVLGALGCGEGWLSGLRGEQRRALLARFEARRVRGGERIVRGGERGPGFFVVVGGRVAVERDGREIARVGPGAFFGEISIIDDVPATADVLAVEDTDCLFLSPNAFQAAMAPHPDQVDAIAAVARSRRNRE